jgi:two-component system, NtrC family, response regulator AlgB
VVGEPPGIAQCRRTRSILCHSDRIGVEYLPGAFSRAVGDMVSLEKVEEDHIRRVLASTGSLQEAAEVLGID